MVNHSYIRTARAAQVSARGWRAYSSTIAALVCCLIGLAAVYVANRGISFTSLAEPLAPFFAVALLGIACRRWETGVQALLVMVIIEGALRKWFLPSFAELVYFYKDALMVAILAGYFMQKRKPPILIKGQLKILLVILGPLLIYALAMIANPSAPHPLVSMFGVKAYCLYMPLAFVVPRMFTTKEKLVRFLRWYLVIALAVSALGAWQFSDNTADSSLNRYVTRQETVERPTQDTALFMTSEGNYFVRITSTFSFVSGLTVYLPVVFALLLGLTSLRSSVTLPFKVRLLYYVAIAAVVATGFMSGSRAAILNMAVVTVIFFVFTSLNHTFRRLRQLVMVGVLVFLTASVIAPQAVDGVYQRAFGGEQQIEEGSERIEAIFSFPFEEASYAGPFGYGIGSTQNSVPALMNRLSLSHSGQPIPLTVENEASRVMLEIGVVGFFLFMLVRMGVLITMFRALISIRDVEIKALALAAFTALLFPLVAGGAVVNHTQNVYQWFLIGIVFALLNADKLARTKMPAANLLQPTTSRARVGTAVPVFDRR